MFPFLQNYKQMVRHFPRKLHHFNNPPLIHKIMTAKWQPLEFFCQNVAIETRFFLKKVLPVHNVIVLFKILDRTFRFF